MFKAVAFTFGKASVGKEPITVSHLLNELEKAVQGAGLVTDKIRVWQLGHGKFGIPISSGGINVSLWPDSRGNSSWQIWIRYDQPKLKRLFHATLPEDLDVNFERTRKVIEEFLAVRAKDIQWISGTEALERLPR